MPKFLPLCIHGLKVTKCRECLREYRRNWYLTHRRNKQGVFIPQTCPHGITPKGNCMECKRIYDRKRRQAQDFDYKVFQKQLSENEKAIIEQQKRQKQEVLQKYYATNQIEQVEHYLRKLDKTRTSTTFLSQIKVDMSSFTTEALERILNDRTASHLLRENSRIELRRRKCDVNN